MNFDQESKSRIFWRVSEGEGLCHASKVVDTNRLTKNQNPEYFILFFPFLSFQGDGEEKGLAGTGYGGGV